MILACPPCEVHRSESSHLQFFYDLVPTSNDSSFWGDYCLLFVCISFVDIPFVYIPFVHFLFIEFVFVDGELSHVTISLNNIKYKQY